MVNSVSG